MTGRLRLAVLAAACAVLLPSALHAEIPGAGQEGPLITSSGLISDGDGWRAPTSAEALWAVRELHDNKLISAMLRQEHERRSAAELAALADSLVRMILADESEAGQVRFAGSSALIVAGMSSTLRGAVPYSGAVDALVRVYETLATRALARGGDDPFREAFQSRAGGVIEHWEFAALSIALSDVHLADRAGRGLDYVLALFERSEPRVDCAFIQCDRDDLGSTYCAAGQVLYDESGLVEGDDEVWRASLPERPVEYDRLCRYGSIKNDIGHPLRTPAEALQAVREGDMMEVGVILRQLFERRPAAELDALADSLVAMNLADRSEEGRVRETARRALGWAGMPAGAPEPDPLRPLVHHPYAGTFDALVRVYETRAARLLADGGDDPFRVAHRGLADGALPEWELDELRNALLDFVHWPDRADRHLDYLLALFDRSDPRDECRRERCARDDLGSTYCAAGAVLFGQSGGAARRARFPDRSVEYERRCRGWTIDPNLRPPG